MGWNKRVEGVIREMGPYVYMGYLLPVGRMIFARPLGAVDRSIKK